jgi:hypothetical protein
MLRALILRGPPGVGKTTLIGSLIEARRAQGETCARAHLDDGWGAGEVRRTPGAPVEQRYPDLVNRPEDLLVVDLCLAEPDFAQTDEPGANRRPREWVDLLRAERDPIVLVRLRAPWWPICHHRVQQREGRIGWNHPWAHAVLNEDAWRFADTVGLNEHLIDAARPAAAVLADVLQLL